MIDMSPFIEHFSTNDFSRSNLFLVTIFPSAHLHHGEKPGSESSPGKTAAVLNRPENAKITTKFNAGAGVDRAYVALITPEEIRNGVNNAPVGKSLVLDNYKTLSLLAVGANIPGITMTTEHDLYSEVEYPTRLSHGRLTLTFILDSQMTALNFCDEWLNSAISPYTHRHSYHEEYIANINIQTFNIQGLTTTNLDIVDCYPVSISEVELKYESGVEISTISVDFSFRRKYLSSITSSSPPIDIKTILAGIANSDPILNNDAIKSVMNSAISGVENSVTGISGPLQTNNNIGSDNILNDGILNSSVLNVDNIKQPRTGLDAILGPIDDAVKLVQGPIEQIGEIQTNVSLAVENVTARIGTVKALPDAVGAIESRIKGTTIPLKGLL